ncbi:hypothetical protein E2C01_069203 [Portunus trituberculatus]|uniref:Uncharacterized protein n=1 Tax=Portunus trituberculatus TaxID=210409 RepID=A0A5B7HZZ5_PORTR|nr:hypothetical protein [Portunus trituberculatus]
MLALIGMNTGLAAQDFPLSLTSILSTSRMQKVSPPPRHPGLEGNPSVGCLPIVRDNEVTDPAAKMALSSINTTLLPPVFTDKSLISHTCRSAWDTTLGDALPITYMGQYWIDSSRTNNLAS